MNPIQFNVYLGLTTLIGFVFSSANFFNSIPLWLIAIFCFILYLGEFWAFLFKIKIVKAKLAKIISHGNPNLRVLEAKDPGCMMFYAFLMRMIFRIVIGMVVIMSFRGSLAKDMNGVQIGFMIAVVLFELFNLMYSLFETHTFKSTSDDATEKEIEQEWEAEKNWRKKYFTKLNDSQFMKKELYANIILIAMAVVTTQIFWGNMNAEFVDFIKRTDKMGESVSFAILTVLISCFVLCLIFLMPVRLAFWIEEKMHADSKAQTSTYRWSLFFAGISICSPSLIQLVVSFIL